MRLPGQILRCLFVSGGFLCAFLLSSCGVSRRDDGGERGPAAPVLPVLIEAHNFISSKPGMSRLDVDVRVPLNFFVFVRAKPESASAQFAARADIAVEILDRTHASIAREILRPEFSSPDQTPGTFPDKFLEKIFSFDLPPGVYTISAEVSDLESNRRFMDRSREITLKDFARDTLRISDAIFLAPATAGDSGPLSPAGFGGDIPFGRNALAYLEFMSPAPAESIRAFCAIRPSRTERKANSSSPPDSLRPVAISHTRFVEPVKGEEGVSYRVSREGGTRRYSVWVPENGDTLQQGEYELETRIADGISSAVVRHPFRIRWIDMPRSLRNVSQAVEALRYVASDSELSRMKSASRDRKKELFDLFWKRRDPTPATAFNERMAEFYRRVDYAMENFESFHESNGMKTDRGKAYILYGPPGTIERDLRPGSDPQETWNYPNLRKRLVFVDRDHHGDYRLAESKDY